MLKSDDLFKVSFNPCAINCAERVLVTRKGCRGKMVIVCTDYRCLKTLDFEK